MENNLKTLKDLPLDKRAKKILSLIAVKWYKDFQGRLYDNELHYSSEWIKYFFNLMPEDLQEEKK